MPLTCSFQYLMIKILKFTLLCHLTSSLEDSLVTAHVSDHAQDKVLDAIYWHGVTPPLYQPKPSPVLLPCHFLRKPRVPHDSSSMREHLMSWRERVQGHGNASHAYAPSKHAGPARKGQGNTSHGPAGVPLFTVNSSEPTPSPKTSSNIHQSSPCSIPPKPVENHMS